MKPSLSHIIRILVVTAVLWSSGVAVGQSYHIKSELVSLFEDQSRDIWVKTYEGLEEYVYPIYFLLGQDGHEYKGIIYYKDTGEKLYYTAKFRNEGKLEMIEKNATGITTGTLDLELSADHIEGVWTSNDFQNTVSLYCVEDKIGKLKRPTCESQNTVTVYRNKSNKKQNITVYKDSEGLSVYDGLLAKYSHKNKVDIPTLDLAYVNDSRYSQSESEDELIIVKNDKKVTLASLEKLTFTCESWTGGGARYSLILPADQGEVFNEWKSSFSSQARKYLDQLKSQPTADAAKRYSVWAGVNAQVSYFDEKFISGDVFSYLENDLLESFVYDRRKDKFLSLTEVIDIDELQLFEKQITSEHTHVKITHDSLVLSKDFDIVYGSDEIEIALKDIKNYNEKVIKYKPLRNQIL